MSETVCLSAREAGRIASTIVLMAPLTVYGWLCFYDDFLRGPVERATWWLLERFTSEREP